MKNNKESYAERVAKELIEQMERGTAPWLKPWEPGEFQRPFNATTNKPYRGMNTVLLAAHGHEDPRWMTYRQASEAGWQVKKGATSVSIQYWTNSEQRPAKDDNGKPIFGADGKQKTVTVELSRPKQFYANVFNAVDVEGIPPYIKPEPTWDAHERAEKILSASAATLRHDQEDSAYYRRSTDTIHLPDKSLFPTAGDYYTTALHELGHWTGHSTRLDRNLGEKHGDANYAMEELRAEIGSFMFNTELGLGHNPERHASYIKGWVSVLQSDPQEIFKAAADAEAIKNYILAYELEYDLQHAPAEEDSLVMDAIEKAHADASPGYSPLDSVLNLIDTAENLGLKATVAFNTDTAANAPPYVITYATEDGAPTGISTELTNNGKAVTFNDGFRVPGTGLQSESLASALEIYHQNQLLLRNTSDYLAKASGYLSHHYGLDALDSEHQSFLEQSSRNGDAPIVGAMTLAQAYFLRLTDDGLLYTIADKFNLHSDRIIPDESLTFLFQGYDKTTGLNKYLLDIDASPLRHIVGVDFDGLTAQVLATISKADATVLTPSIQQLLSEVELLSMETQLNLDIYLDIDNHAARFRELDAGVNAPMVDSEPAKSLTGLDPALMEALAQAHADANPGYSPLESVRNLIETADTLGLKATPAFNTDPAEYAAPYVITYTTQDGSPTGISTEMYNDGKAATSNDGSRVPGTGLTSYAEWQSDSLTVALQLYNQKHQLLRDAPVAASTETVNITNAPTTDVTDPQQTMPPAPAQITAAPKTAPPEGWSETSPGGMMTNPDPLNGGIIDSAIVSGKWFMVFNRDNLEKLIDLNVHPKEGFATREDAIDAFYATLNAALANDNSAPQGEHLEPTEPTRTPALPDGWVEVEPDGNILNADNETGGDLVKDRRSGSWQVSFNDWTLPRPISEFDTFGAAMLHFQSTLASRAVHAALNASPADDTAPLPELAARLAPHVLDADITTVLQSEDVGFDHYVSFIGKDLESALRDRGLNTIADITGKNPDDFYDTASTNLAPVFSSASDVYGDPSNPVLEHTGLVHAFSSHAEALILTLEQEQERSNLPTQDLDSELEQPKPYITIESIIPLGDKVAAMLVDPDGNAQESVFDDHNDAKGYVAAFNDMAATRTTAGAAAPYSTLPQGEAVADIAQAPADASTTAQQPEISKVYLAVPYAERLEAKTLGARWDKDVKSWYVYADPKTIATHGALGKWLPSTNEKEPPSPRDAFANVLRDLDCLVPLGSEHPIMDGKKHRIATTADKGPDKSGFYIAYGDGVPNGYAINNRSGHEIKWKHTGDPSTRPAVSDAERAAFEATVEKRRKDTAALHESVAEKLRVQTRYSLPVTEPTPYLERKGISGSPGIYTDSTGATTFIPIHDATGKVWTAQTITPDGAKRYVEGGAKEGHFHALGGMEALNRSPVIIISEGYATAASVSAAAGFATVAAFDAGNLLPAAMALREHYPDRPILIAGDDDRALVMQVGVNRGYENAKLAASAVSGLTVFPQFARTEGEYDPTLPVITPEAYKAKAVSEEQLAALDAMRGFTDFNDLATKSVLGPSAINIQIQTAIQRCNWEKLTIADFSQLGFNDSPAFVEMYSRVAPRASNLNGDCLIEQDSKCVTFQWSARLDSVAQVPAASRIDLDAGAPKVHLAGFLLVDDDGQELDPKAQNAFLREYFSVGGWRGQVAQTIAEQAPQQDADRHLGSSAL